MTGYTRIWHGTHGSNLVLITSMMVPYIGFWNKKTLSKKWPP